MAWVKRNRYQTKYSYVKYQIPVPYRSLKYLDLRFYRWSYSFFLGLWYTGCHRRNGPNFGRVFLMLNYTDVTQNTHIQSWMVTEIMAREKCGHLAFPRTVHLQLFSALTLTEQCSTHLCACTSSAERDKIVFHYCRHSCAMYSAW